MEDDGALTDLGVGESEPLTEDDSGSPPGSRGAREVFLLELSLDCAKCGSMVPVNALVDEVSCRQCLTPWAFLRSSWSAHVHADSVLEALTTPFGRISQSHGFTPIKSTFKFGRAFIRCDACKTKVELGALPAAVPAGHHTCAGCGRSIRVRAADAACISLFPGALWVVGESAHDEAARAVEAHIKPVLFACMGCGGHLQVDGSTRMISCQFCSASNYLPDGLWLQLRPIPTTAPFFVVCEFDRVTRRRLSWTDAERRARDAESVTDLTEAELSTLVNDKDSDVREALARNPALPVDSLATLSRDRHWPVRAAVAESTRLPEADLRRIALDEEGEVVAAVAGNPTTPPDVLLSLASYNDYRVKMALLRNPLLSGDTTEPSATELDSKARAKAARDPRLPYEALHVLALDRDAEVRAAAKARLESLRNQRVDVGPGLGLWRKLRKILEGD